MNSKMKGLFILGLVVVAAVASMSLLTASAAANGDTIQTRDRTQDCVNDLVGGQTRGRTQNQLQDQNCVNDCFVDQTRDRTQDQLRDQDCLQDCEQNYQQGQAQLQTRCHFGGC